MRSVRNALRVLDELAAAGPLGVGELARRTGIAKSTVQRCLETLAEAGWIEVGFDGGPGSVTGWVVAERIRDLLSTESPDLLQAATPILHELTRATEEATHLVTLDGDDVVLRLRVAAPGPVQVVLPIGHTVPAHAAATGKAMLAAMDADELADRLRGPRRALTDSTIVDAAALDAELAQIRERGWASNLGEWHRQVAAVAAPVIVGGRPIAAVSVSTTPDRLDAERLPIIAAQVIAAADAVAARRR